MNRLALLVLAACIAPTFVARFDPEPPATPPVATAPVTAWDLLSVPDQKRVEEYAKTCRLAPDGAVWTFAADDFCRKTSVQGGDANAVRRRELIESPDAPRWYDVDNDRRAIDLAAARLAVAVGPRRANLPEDVRAMGLRFVPKIQVLRIRAADMVVQRAPFPLLDSDEGMNARDLFELVGLPAEVSAIEGKVVDVNMEIRYVRSRPPANPRSSGTPIYEFVRSIKLPPLPEEKAFLPIDGPALAQHMLDRKWDGLPSWDIRRAITKPAEPAKRVPSGMRGNIVTSWSNVPAKPAEYGLAWVKTETRITFQKRSVTP